MASNIWVIFATVLLVTVGASRYDQGPQQFYDISYDSETAEQNENKEIILYLTPEQVKALEAEGAVVQSDNDSNEETNDDDPEIPAAPVTEEQEEDELEGETSAQDDGLQQGEVEREEVNLDNQNQGVDFEAILRLLNEEQVNDETTEEEPVEPENEEITENPRKFSPKVTLKQPEQPQKEQTTVVAKKDQVLKTYSYIRYQPNEQPQRINIQLLQGTEPVVQELEKSLESTPASIQEKRKYKLVPAELEVTSEETPQEENVQQQTPEPEVAVPVVTDSKVLSNDLRNLLKELKASPKYNNQKYAIEVARLKSLQKVKALAKANEIAKTIPALIQQQVNKKRLNIKKQRKVSTADTKETKLQQSSAQRTSVENQETIAVPVMDIANPNGEKPIAVPVEVPRVISVKNVYVKTRTDKPYIVNRRIPLNQKLNPSDAPKSKPEKITILRHIWEQ